MTFYIDIQLIKNISFIGLFICTIIFILTYNFYDN